MLTMAALYRDESKVYRYRHAQTARLTIDIYSCSGKLISRINVDTLLGIMLEAYG